MPKLLQAVLVVAGTYTAFRVVFDLLLDHPVPSSLLTMYIFFVVVGVIMVFTATDEGTRELLAPLVSLVEDPRLRVTRNIIFALLPLLAGGYAYLEMLPGAEPPLESRTIHPPPPSSISLFGKSYNLAGIENPYRHLEEEAPERFAGLVMEGREVYIRNCHFCHGDKLDGRGPYAAALDPRPTNFRDIGTIAQLQESYLFWRIATGGPGLPKEAAPWRSSMPAWGEFLSEDEIWKVILFLYDATGHRPRAWGGGPLGNTAKGGVR